MRADYHMHTNFSVDSNAEMEKMILSAIKLSLNEICFTEHIDEVPLTRQYDCDHKAYYIELSRLKEKYKNDISIKMGMEFGMQTSTIPAFNDIFSKYDFDFIILSCHQVNNLEFWDQSYQKGKTEEEFVMGYYNEILEIVKKYDDYSILGHLDVINRYDNYGVYPFEKLKPILTEILTIIIEKGKGIEVNTSSFRYKLNDTTPSNDILKLYKSLGGSIVTLGSDAHKEEDIAYNFDSIITLLKDIGFEYFCTFDKMKPIFHNL